MKIAMVFNIIPDYPASILGLPHNPMGGWLMSMIESLQEISDFNFDIISPYNGKELQQLKSESLNFYLIPSDDNEIFWEEYFELANPEIIHLNGTELNFSYALINLSLKIPVIISLQGILNEIYKVYNGNIPSINLLRSLTLKDLVRGTTPFRMKKAMSNKSIYELKLLNKANIIIGRTDWDYSFIVSHGLHHKYRSCNENLRDSFYSSNKWSFNSSENLVIFCSQATVPYKGFHVLVEAINIVRKYIPDLTVKIAGMNIIKNETISDKILRSTYGRYILKLISDNDLASHFNFLGLLAEKEMVSEYLSSDIFIQTSFVENSSNSLGEALYLGVPTIASDVGGTSYFVDHKLNGLLYPAHDSTLLAGRILELYKDKQLLQQYSKESILRSEIVHDRILNARKLISIYNEAINLGDL